ncbi:MAG: ACT domain-containing protein [Desulfovibrionaceae bacterium]|jgi:acetolactate synthase-1/3 small subunit
MPSPVIQLNVNNHPGVMSHITGLFSRRAFNLEGILCGPVEDGSRSVMLLMVDEDLRLSQLIKELERLHDVHEVDLRHDVPAEAFNPLR